MIMFLKWLHCLVARLFLNTDVNTKPPFLPLLLKLVSWQFSNPPFFLYISNMLQKKKKDFKWFILPGPSVLLSWSINKGCRDANQWSLSLTSEGRGQVLLLSAEEGPCYSGNSHPKHQLTGLLFLVSHLDKVISVFFFFCYLAAWFSLVVLVFLGFHPAVTS